MRALLIEDHKEVSAYLEKGLREEGFNVDAVADGKEGLGLASTETYDVMIVDRMLPKVDGLSIVKSIRATNNDTPVMVISALGEVDDRVRGLKAGGDDYLCKPFAFSELSARVEAIIRRRKQAGKAIETVLRCADLELDLLSRSVKRDGKNIRLQTKEFQLLEYMVRNQGEVVTRTMLLENVWNYYFDPQTNVIDVHISRLRGKLDEGFDTSLIHTVRGAGYILGEEQ